MESGWYRLEHTLVGEHLVAVAGPDGATHVALSVLGHLSDGQARERAALQAEAEREQVIKPLLAGVRTPHQGRPPKSWTPIDRRYQTLRVDMQRLFAHLGLAS
jgi:hypothetical protein